MDNVHVLMRFDIEDYIVPEADDATLTAADLLSRRNLRGVFKVVGEYARRLVRTGRADIIAALQKHDIGYHTDWHSLPPTPAHYLQDMGWDEGVAEFVRREQQGIEDVQRHLGTISCYGQPGGSWAPQVLGALRTFAVAAHVSRRSLVGLWGQPFHYCGLLNIARTKHDIAVGHGMEEDRTRDQLVRRFHEAVRETAAAGGGLVSITVHPARFVIDGRDSDAENFPRARYRSRAEWVSPPLKPEASIHASYCNFEKLVDEVQASAASRWLTMHDAIQLYGDEMQGKQFDARAVAEVAEAALERVHFARIREGWVSAAEMLWLILSALGQERPDQDGIECRSTIGPCRERHSRIARDTVPKELLLRAATSAHQFMSHTGRVPSETWLDGNCGLAPQDLLATAAAYYLHNFREGPSSSDVHYVQGKVDWSDYVRPENARDTWDWTCLPEGFHSSNLYNLAELQCWSLKPAVARE